MSEETTIPQESTAGSMKMLRAMVGIGVLCALLIVLTFEGTKPRIAKLRAEALEQAIFKVLPGITKTKAYEFKGGSFVLSEGKDKTAELIYAGYSDAGEFVGVAIEAAGQGYADIIKVLYGYNPNTQKIIGFYVLESKETPGLGDKIEKDDNFLANFKGLDVNLNEALNALVNVVIPVKTGEKNNPWEVEGITGATISSRAIGNLLDVSAQKWAPIIFQKQSDFESKSTE
ncbi:MAG: FMN-binding protein [Reichenbachiella sp.]